MILRGNNIAGCLCNLGTQHSTVCRERACTNGIYRTQNSRMSSEWGVHCSYLRVEMDNFGWNGPCGGKLVPNPRTRELTGTVQCHNRIIKEVSGVMPLESMAKPYQTETPAQKLCKQQTSTLPDQSRHSPEQLRTFCLPYHHKVTWIIFPYVSKNHPWRKRRRVQKKESMNFIWMRLRIDLMTLFKLLYQETFTGLVYNISLPSIVETYEGNQISYRKK